MGRSMEHDRSSRLPRAGRRATSALAIGCLLLAVTACAPEEETGIRLQINTDVITAPENFDVLQLVVTSEAFRTLEKPYDLLSDELAASRDRHNNVTFPLDLLILAAGSTGTEVFIAVDAYLCKEGSGPARSQPLGEAQLLSCVASPDNRVGTNMGKAIGEGDTMIVTVKLEKGKIKDQAITITRLGADCKEDNDQDGYTPNEGCAPPLDCDDSNPEIHPGQTENCDDHIDNNCNGAVDEGCACTDADPPPSCYTGPADTCPPLGCRGVCQKGEQRCEDMAWSTTCYGEVTPTDELCDGDDNDCNGVIDDIPDGSGEFCEKTAGVCAGCRKRCEAGAWQPCTTSDYLSCSGGTYQEIETACDFMDNDCNGQMDPNPPCQCPAGEIRDCYDGEAGTENNPPCKAGTTTCQPNNEWGTCVGQVVPEQESCDNIDNDCNGTVDNGFPQKGLLCTRGLGECRREGIYVCNATGDGVTCDAPEVQGTPELCNGLDDDCDGSVDNGNPEGGAECDTTLLGVCAAGHTFCQTGELNCVQDVQPSSEVCNALDDDCNGQTDEGDDVDLCFPPPVNAVPVCNAGTCEIGECLPDFVDSNGDYADGCECGVDAWEGRHNTCDDAKDLGEVFDDDAGDAKEIEGNILSDTDVDWITIYARDLKLADEGIQCDRFDFKVIFVNNPDNVYVFDVFKGSCTDAPHATNCDSFQFETDLTLPGGIGECPCVPELLRSLTVNTCQDTSDRFFIKIYRIGGRPVLCDPYLIRITNGI